MMPDSLALTDTIFHSS